MTIACTGFTAGETVEVYLDTVTSTSRLASKTARTSGNASLALVVPETVHGSHVWIVRGRTSRHRVSVVFSMKTTVAMSVRSGPAGTKPTVRLHGFAANEIAKVVWYDGTARRTLKTITVSAKGSASAVFTVPNAVSGSHKVYLRGATGTIAKSSFTVTTSTFQSSSVEPQPRPVTAMPTSTAVPLAPATHPTEPTASPFPEASPIAN